MTLRARAQASLLAVLLVALGCEDGGSPDVTSGGAGGATAGSAGAGGASSGGSGGAPVDGSADVLPDVHVAIDVPIAEAGDDAARRIGITLVDDFEAKPLSSDASDGADPDASPRWSLHLTFDHDIETAEIAPGLPGEVRIPASLMHDARDKEGAPNSGSLAVQREEEVGDFDAGVVPTYVRMFSTRGGAPLDLRGYRLSANVNADVNPIEKCYIDVHLYVRAGTERIVFTSSITRVISRLWRPVTFDLPLSTTSVDLSQVDEIGLTIARGLCLPI